MIGSRPLAALGLLAIAASASAAPQSIVNTTKSNTKDFAVAPADPAAAEGINTSRSNLRNSFRLAPGEPLRIATPIEIRFADPAGFDDFAAGRLPVTLVLRNAASGQTIRFDPLVIDLRPGTDKSRVTLDAKIDGVDSALLERGCFETSTEAAAAGEGVRISVTYTPCGAGPAQRAVNPIPGIGITVKKDPGHRLVVATGPSTVGNAASARLGTQNVIPVPSGKGTGSPKAAGF